MEWIDINHERITCFDLNWSKCCVLLKDKAWGERSWTLDSHCFLYDFTQVFQILNPINIDDAVHQIFIWFQTIFSDWLLFDKSVVFFSNFWQTRWFPGAMYHNCWLTKWWSRSTSPKKVKSFIYDQIIIKNLLVLYTEGYKISFTNCAFSFSRSSLSYIACYWFSYSLAIWSHNFLILSPQFHSCDFS